MTIKILSTLLIATTLASDAFTKDIATLWTIGEKDGRGDKFVIKARNASRKNIYVQSAVLNGKRLNGFTFPASELLKEERACLRWGRSLRNDRTQKNRAGVTGPILYHIRAKELVAQREPLE